MNHALQDGNINRIMYGTDWAGNACGDSDHGTGSYKNQYWPNPLFYAYLGSVCLDSCPANGTGYSAGADVICTCNNQLTVGRTESGVANSVNDTSTYLGNDCF